MTGRYLSPNLAPAAQAAPAPLAPIVIAPEPVMTTNAGKHARKPRRSRQPAAAQSFARRSRARGRTRGPSAGIDSAGPLHSQLTVISTKAIDYAVLVLAVDALTDGRLRRARGKLPEQTRARAWVVLRGAHGTFSDDPFRWISEALDEHLTRWPL